MALFLIGAEAAAFIEAALVRSGIAASPLWINTIRPLIMPVLRFLGGTRIGRYVSGAIGGLLAGASDAFEGGKAFIGEIIKDYMSRMLGFAVEYLDRESVKTYIGKFVANQIKTAYRAKVHREFLIDNVYPFNEFMDNLGIFLAQEANSKIGEQVFTTFYPYTEVLNEAEAYAIDRINGELGTHLTSLEPSEVQSEVQKYVIDFVQGLVQGGLEEAMGIAQDRIDEILDNLTDGGIELSAYQRVQMQSLIIERLNEFITKVTNKFDSFLPVAKTKTSAKARRARRLSRKRQKRWRESHVQVTEWVSR